MGYVGDHLTLAGGGDYGDETVSQSLCFMKKKNFRDPTMSKMGVQGGNPAWEGLETKQVFLNFLENPLNYYPGRKLTIFQGENDLQKRVCGGCERPSRMVP